MKLLNWATTGRWWITLILWGRGTEWAVPLSYRNKKLLHWNNINAMNIIYASKNFEYKLSNTISDFRIQVKWTKCWPKSRLSYTIYRLGIMAIHLPHIQTSATPTCPWGINCGAFNLLALPSYTYHKEHSSNQCQVLQNYKKIQYYKHILLPGRPRHGSMTTYPELRTQMQQTGDYVNKQTQCSTKMSCGTNKYNLQTGTWLSVICFN